LLSFKERMQMQKLESTDLERVSSIFDIDQTVPPLCPICLKVINARIMQDENAVLIDKRCEEHGDYRDVYWSDVALYRRFMSYWSDGWGVYSPIQSLEGCPLDCGLCENHKSSTYWAISMLPTAATCPARSALPMRVKVRKNRH
jgi:uncharacterized radical SAM superfamily Fe-S cluster-containing enzyme